MLVPTDDLLRRAFGLAYFIHGDKDTAVRIVSGAMDKLEVAATAQYKRLYYHPNSRGLLRKPRSVGFRNKVTLNELHLLQRLIYIESESYEREKEAANSNFSVGKEELIIRFIKHLMRITLKRNSFYVTLGLSRLLYSYTTTETMGIYNAVVQDPDRVKDDYYYRSRKGVLMHEIRERFGALVNISQGQRGEERFKADPHSSQFAKLVRECLSLFTPWDTACLVPANYNPMTDTIADLSYKGDNEDKTEVDRIHAVVHPDCFQRLIQALGFHTPEQRLEVPQFFVSKENGGGGQNSPPTPRLDKEDLNTIKSNLEELSKRRRTTPSAGLLRVLVDGVEYARLDPTRASHVRVNLSGDGELIEVRTTDQKGDLLLASHLLTYEEGVAAKTTKGSITLEGGQNLSIVVSPAADAAGPVVDVSYKQTNRFKAAKLALTGLLSGDNQSLFAGRPLIAVSASVIILTFAIGVFVYLQRQPKQFQAASSAPNSDTSPNSISSQQTLRDDQSSRPTQVPDSQQLNDQKRATEDTAGQRGLGERPKAEQESTRGQGPAGLKLSLIELKTVFVEVKASEPFGSALGEALSQRVQASNRFSLSNGRDTADALLKVSMTAGKRDNEPQVVRAQLLNANGQVVWPVNGRSWQRTFPRATVEQISAEILTELLHDVRKAR